jgi:S-adenosylmethionine:tRNA ribosyltransferase-isomerase
VIAPAPRAAAHFIVPAELEAASPPERRGVPRDGVRLLVATPTGLFHRHFRDLPGLLAPGDLIVVNTSATLPAGLTGCLAGRAVPVHVSGSLDDSTWIVEVRRADNSGPDLDRAVGDDIRLAGGIRLRLTEPYPAGAAAVSRLWLATLTPAVASIAYLSAHGHPITYAHTAASFPLSDHQTVYADEPGSAEMASAGRPFTAGLIVRMVTAGVTVAPLTLHAGVSSPEFHETPVPESFSVPDGTARLVMATREAGHRVVAVGTTVVRALETVARPDGSIHGGSGWTDLVLGPDRSARVVTGLVTGLHLPESSHLLLLEAVAGGRLVSEAYAAALARRYLWHEFGDSMLFLP